MGDRLKRTRAAGCSERIDGAGSSGRGAGDSKSNLQLCRGVDFDRFNERVLAYCENIISQFELILGRGEGPCLHRSSTHHRPAPEAIWFLER